MSELKLLALDSDDLSIISAYTQDAVLRVADMGFSKSDNRFVLLLNRYVWENDKKQKSKKEKWLKKIKGERNTKGERRRSALRFDFVQKVQAKGFDLKAVDGVLELLSIEFRKAPDSKNDPSGIIILNFAGGATLRLEVECLEARIHDLGAAWRASARPNHNI